MRTTPFKWLLIGLMAVSFAGRPWAQVQVLPASTQGCGGSSAAAIEHAYSAATHETGKIATSETTTPKADSTKPMIADCVKTCAATPVLGITAMAWSPEVWPQIHSTAIEIVLNGHSPKPELSPPIAPV